MFVAITGTPGTGKSSTSIILREKGFNVVDLNKIAIENDLLVGIDKKRDSKIINISGLNDHIKKRYAANEIVFIEGHLSHLLKSIENVIILRCHPLTLRKRLDTKKWNDEKIKENIEAEALDIILCESFEIHSEKKIFEVDTTNISVESVASSIIEIVKNEFRPMKKYNIGNIDWSEELLNNY